MAGGLTALRFDRGESMREADFPAVGASGLPGVKYFGDFGADFGASDSGSAGLAGSAE